jgi:hypothetical protein
MTGVEWSASTRYKLRLRVTLDWKKYEKGGLILPPPELGQCKEWRFQISTDQSSALFLSTWERRMVPDDVDLSIVIDKIKPYIKTN